MKYREFVKILEENGFELDRQKGRHRQYEGVVKGQRRIVTVACSQLGDDIMRKNFASMIRQSGLPKALFRK